MTEQRTILITGGASGIGRAIAHAFAVEGARVIATCVNHSEIAEFEQDLRRADVGWKNLISTAQLDVADGASIDHVMSSLSRLDVLVNGAGIIARGQEQEPEKFAQVINVNLNGAMRMCAAALPLLRQSRGCVLNIASMLSFFGSGPAPAYSASKGGIAQLTKSLAIAWAAEGIRVNALAPGWIATKLTEPLRNDPVRSQKILDRTPLGRWGQSEEVAPAALFLCSPAASFITGVVLPVDGGYLIS